MTQTKNMPLGRRLVRLAVGLAVLGGVFWFFAFGPAWPGFAGRVLESNVNNDIQATALSYRDLERIDEIAARTDVLRED